MIRQNKIAFVGFGEINSPRELIAFKCRQALNEIKSLGADVVTTDVVTDDAEGRDVQRAISDLRAEHFDVLVICLAGWIPSHAVITVASAFKHHPMILWGLAGDTDENGHIVTAAAQAGTTALRKVFNDLGYKFKYVYNIIGRPVSIKKMSDFIRASFAVQALSTAKVGMMGYRDMKLYNTLYEGISLKEKLGIEIDFFEMLEMVQLADAADDREIDKVLTEIMNEWHFTKSANQDFLKQGIAYYLAIKRIADERNYSAISLKDVDGMKKILKFPPAMIFMLLSDKGLLPTIPENDAMGAVTQLVVKELTGQCGAYLEFYEFFEDSVLMGVPDYVPAEVVEGRVTVTNAAFGDISGGILNISSLKTGRVTLARLSNTAGEYAMHIVTGTAKPRSWEEAGWDKPAPQLPSVEIFLDTSVEDFADQVSGQHYIISYGDNTACLKEFCYLTGIKCLG